MNIINWYHTDVFMYLHEQLEGRFQHALIEVPLQLRRRELLPQLSFDGMDRDIGWSLFRQYLSAIESQLESVLRHHSVGFWIHLYRRIGVMLSPNHDNKTDPMTLALVRKLAELAIHKYARADWYGDMASSKEIPVAKILGGHFMRVAKKRYRKDPAQLRAHIDSLKTKDQWVMRAFTVTDLVSIYSVEGLAYEYWRATAALRAIGKGARVKRAQDDWDYDKNAELARLISSYDERIEAQPLSHSLFGSWFHPEKERDAISVMFTPYNAGRNDMAPFMRALGIDIPGAFKSNFVLAYADLKGFRRAHDFIADAFKIKHGYSLDTFLAVLAAASSLVEMPNVLAEQLQELGEIEKRNAIGRHILNLLQRGYSLYEERAASLAEEILSRAALFSDHLANIEEENIAACVADLTLSTDKKPQIGIWAGGRRFPFISIGRNKFLIDCVGYQYVLQSLFFAIAAPGAIGAKELAKQRGSEFEIEFRAGLDANGFERDRQGVIENSDGDKREIDASVKIGSKLYLFECRTAERPLDFEIGKPATIDARCRFLNEKVAQLDSLVEFIKACPKGKNYDFSWANEVISLVVSPFIEWIWSKEARLWLDRETPKIVSADEVMLILRREA